MGTNDNLNPKFLLKNGRQVIDYIGEAGFGLGFSMGRAVECMFKSLIDPARKEKHINDANWFINYLARQKNFVREELVAIVTSIVSKLEKDMVEQSFKEKTSGK